jgi:hypothetical protein
MGRKIIEESAGNHAQKIPRVSEFVRVGKIARTTRVTITFAKNMRAVGGLVLGNI